MPPLIDRRIVLVNIESVSQQEKITAATYTLLAQALMKMYGNKDRRTISADNSYTVYAYIWFSC